MTVPLESRSNQRRVCPLGASPTETGKPMTDTVTPVTPAVLAHLVANAATGEEALELLAAHFPDDPYELADAAVALNSATFGHFYNAIRARYTEIRARQGTERFRRDIRDPDDRAALADLAEHAENVLIVLNACSLRRQSRAANPLSDRDRQIAGLRAQIERWSEQGQSVALSELVAFTEAVETEVIPCPPSQEVTERLNEMRRRHWEELGIKPPPPANPRQAANILANAKTTAESWRGQGGSDALAELDRFIARADQGEWMIPPAEVAGTWVKALKAQHVEELAVRTAVRRADLPANEPDHVIWKAAAMILGRAIARHRQLTEEGDPAANDKLWGSYASAMAPCGPRADGPQGYQPLAEIIDRLADVSVTPF